MKKAKTVCLTLLLTLLFAGVATAELYKWVDENGVINLSDQPPQGSESTGDIRTIPTYRYDSRPVRNSDNGSQAPNEISQDSSYAAKRSKRGKMPRVELYTTSWCHYCEHARNFFRSRGISFTEYDIEKDKSAAKRKKLLDTGNGGVPFAVINEQRIQGFSEAAYARALGRAQ